MTKFLYLNASSVPKSPNVLSLSRFVDPIRDDDTCQKALSYFFSDQNLFALPIVNECQKPVGIIERHAFVEFFGKQYSRELHGKKNINSMPATVINHKPIIVDASTSVDDAAQIIIDAGVEHSVSGFIICEESRYIGVANAHILLNEITQRRQAELYSLAHYDQLTGLPNRRLFLDRLNQACREAKRSGLMAAVMFIDIDRFKQINDNLGHASGDHLLINVANRLHECARECDIAARLSGDEFGILIEGLESTVDLQHIAARILESMSHPINIMDHDLYITVSIGISLYPNDDVDVEGLLNKADAAMYEVKSNGRNGFKFYVPGLAPDSLDSMSLEMELRNALSGKQLVLYYQPQIEIVSGKVTGVEALVRWQHPVRGLLSPAHFIPIAEQSRLIVDIGYWVLKAACEQQLKWLEEGLAPINISINVSTLQFQQHDFCHIVEGIIHETGVNPSYLEFELTESIMMHDNHKALETLRYLKGLGVSLALDDFGTGFSSLGYLRQFPIDHLKIDQSFIRDIEKSSSGESIVRAITLLGKSLSMKVIAEGVETSEEFNVIQCCNCDAVQGYLFSRPIPANALVKGLREDFWQLPGSFSLPHALIYKECSA